MNQKNWLLRNVTKFKPRRNAHHQETFNAGGTSHLKQFMVRNVKVDSNKKIYSDNRMELAEKLA